MRTGRRPDIVDDHNTIVERVRKLEIMPNPRTLTPERWQPGYEDLYAIAGHIYMLGCFDNPYHTSTPDYFAHPGQAAQMLWALLDERGFGNEDEARQWTSFLLQLGALPRWSRYRYPVEMDDGPLSGAMAAEARANFSAGPWLRTGYDAASSAAGEHVFQARALYWAGVPARFPWQWVPVTGSTPESSIPPLAEVEGYYLWDGTGPIDGGFFRGMPDEEPVIVQENYWLDTRPEPDQLVFCGSVEPKYNSSEFPGVPYGPFASGSYPCPTLPGPGEGSFEPSGFIWRYRLAIPGPDLFLIAPPRIQDPALLTNSYWSAALSGGGVPHASGPGLDWLADGVNATLGSYPLVAAFYANYLPIANAAKYQTGRYRWQQLEVIVTCRGRVAAHREPDRVILKGALDSYATSLPSDLFRWPADWPHPAATAVIGSYLTADSNGQMVPLSYNRVNRTFSIPNSWRTGNDGPREIRFDGLVIPTELSV